MTLFCEVCKDEVDTAYTDDGELVCSNCGCELAGAAAAGIHIVGESVGPWEEWEDVED